MTPTNTNNYYHSRGITVQRCVCQCQELGLNPANWANLSAAFEILKTQYALRNY